MNNRLFTINPEDLMMVNPQDISKFYEYVEPSEEYLDVLRDPLRTLNEWSMN